MLSVGEASLNANAVGWLEKECDILPMSGRVWDHNLLDFVLGASCS